MDTSTIVSGLRGKLKKERKESREYCDENENSWQAQAA